MRQRCCLSASKTSHTGCDPPASASSRSKARLRTFAVELTARPIGSAAGLRGWLGAVALPGRYQMFRYLRMWYQLIRYRTKGAGHDKRPHTPQPTRPPLAILLALALGVLLAALDQTIVATALPTVAGELGGLTDLAWVVTAYLVAETVSTPLYGKLGDVIGRKRVLVAAILLFLTGSALSGLAGSMLELVLFRALQGLGAGGLIVTAMAVIGDLVAPHERARYMGMIGGVFAVASVAGPAAGRPVRGQLSWRWVFYVNVPVGAAALLVIATKLPASPARRAQARRRARCAAADRGRRRRRAGHLLGRHRVRVGLARDPGPRGNRRRRAGRLHRCRSGAPPTRFVPLGLFRNRAFSIASASGFMVGMAMFGAIMLLPLYLQVVDGASATTAGLRMLPFVAGSLVAAAISGRLISASGSYKPYPVAGAILIALGMLRCRGSTSAPPPCSRPPRCSSSASGGARDAGGDPRGAEQRAPAPHGRRDLDRDVPRAIGASIGVARDRRDLREAPDRRAEHRGQAASVARPGAHSTPRSGPSPRR